VRNRQGPVADLFPMLPLLKERKTPAGDPTNISEALNAKALTGGAERVFQVERKSSKRKE